MLDGAEAAELFANDVFGGTLWQTGNVDVAVVSKADAGRFLLVFVVQGLFVRLLLLEILVLRQLLLLSLVGGMMVSVFTFICRLLCDYCRLR